MGPAVGQTSLVPLRSFGSLLAFRAQHLHSPPGQSFSSRNVPRPRFPAWARPLRSQIAFAAPRVVVPKCSTPSAGPVDAELRATSSQQRCDTPCFLLPTDL